MSRFGARSPLRPEMVFRTLYRSSEATDQTLHRPFLPVIEEHTLLQDQLVPLELFPQRSNSFRGHGEILPQLLDLSYHPDFEVRGHFLGFDMPGPKRRRRRAHPAARAIVRPRQFLRENSHSIQRGVRNRDAEGAPDSALPHNLSAVGPRGSKQNEG